MKKSTNIADLSARLTNAVTKPLVQVAPVVQEVQTPKPRNPVKRRGITVFLRLPPELYASLDAEAVTRTKAKGRGVTVQQVIIDKLQGSR